MKLMKQEMGRLLRTWGMSFRTLVVENQASSGNEDIFGTIILGT